MNRFLMFSGMAGAVLAATLGAGLRPITIRREPSSADTLEVDAVATTDPAPKADIINAPDQIAAAEAKRARKNARRLANARAAA